MDKALLLNRCLFKILKTIQKFILKKSVTWDLLELGINLKPEFVA